MKIDTILNILWYLKPTNKAAFIKYGKQLFNDDLLPKRDKSTKLRDFVQIYYGLTDEDFFYTKNEKSSEAKGVFYYLHKKYINSETNKMAMLTKRHKTTIYAAMRAFENRMDTSEPFRASLETIEESLMNEDFMKITKRV